MLHLSRRGNIRPAINLKNIIEAHTTHGLSHHPLYKIWCGMKQRCDNPKSRYYEHYGGRGIKYCSRWKDFRLFFIDVIEGYSTGLELDRFPNNNGDYEPTNFRWATREQQMSNIRSNKWIEYNGETMTLSQWAKKFNKLPATLYNYLKTHTFEKKKKKYS